MGASFWFDVGIGFCRCDLSAGLNKRDYRTEVQCMNGYTAKIVFGQLRKVISAGIAAMLLAGPIGGPVKAMGDYLTGGDTGTVAAFEYNAKGYPVPDLNGMRKYSDKMVDRISDVPGKDVRVEKFKDKSTGYRYIKLSYNGKIFAYTINMKSKGKYGIVDEDGDGRFEKKGKYRERYSTPEWIK